MRRFCDLVRGIVWGTPGHNVQRTGHKVRNSWYKSGKNDRSSSSNAWRYCSDRCSSHSRCSTVHSPNTEMRECIARVTKIAWHHIIDSDQSWMIRTDRVTCISACELGKRLLSYGQPDVTGTLSQTRWKHDFKSSGHSKSKTEVRSCSSSPQQNPYRLSSRLIPDHLWLYKHSVCPASKAASD